MNKFIVLIVGSFIAWGAGASTIVSPLSAGNADKYFSIENYSVEVLEEETVSDFLMNTMMDECSSASAETFSVANDILDEVLIDQIINYGQRIWEVIVANKPVVNINEMSANALPQGINCWSGLANWAIPNSTAYEVVYTNGFGMEVVKFKYRLFYTYGGSLEGQGAYLANVSITPMAVDVAWGFQFDADVEVEQVVNLGPLADPIAGMELAMKWKVETPFKYSAQQVKYFVTGDGRDQEYQ